MVAGASDGAAVDRSSAASGNFRPSSTGVPQACTAVWVQKRRRLAAPSLLLLLAQRLVGVRPPFRLGLRLILRLVLLLRFGGARSGFVVDVLVHRLHDGRRRGFLLGALDGF